MRKNYLAKKVDLLAIEEALRYVWDSKLDFIFRDKAPVRATVIVSFDSEFIYLWTQMKLSGLISISCQLKNYFAYKIPHQLSIPIGLQYTWHVGISPEIENLLPHTIKNSSRFSIPLISGGLFTPFTTLQKSFRKKNNPYTTRKSYLATIIHEFGHVYWNKHKLWWYSNREENLKVLATAKQLYDNEMKTLMPTIWFPDTEGIGELFATCAEYQASSFFWPDHQRKFDLFAANRIEHLLVRQEQTKNLEQEDSVLEPQKFPHDFAIVLGRIILDGYPKIWPQILTTPYLLQPSL